MTMKCFILSVFILFQIIIHGEGNDEDASICDYCKCYDSTVDCKNSNLDKIPKTDFPPKTTDLIMMSNALIQIQAFDPGLSLSNISFKHNLIRKIQEKSFENLPNLTYLDLSHNLLTSDALMPLVFIGPSTVPGSISPIKVLKLGSNSIHSLYQDLFEFLQDLEELDLSSNPLNVLDHGSMVALSSIHKIRSLDLSSTSLSSIPRRWLNAAINLEVLNLSSNKLTKVQFSLEETRGLRHLILDNNPIEVIRSFPKIPTLKVLDLNWMPKLVAIKGHAFLNLSGITELNIANNHYLTEISEDILIEPGTDIPDDPNEGYTFPPLEKIDLSNNRLGYLEENLLDRWDRLKELKLDSNPWICDCENQWMVSKLVKLMNEKNIGLPQLLICGEPVEMKGKSMLELAMRQYEMRCLDYYGNQPDKDAKVLIIVLVVVLISIPVSLLFLHLIKKPRGNNGYPSAYYRRAHSFESIN